METKIQRWGNSVGIRIPHTLLKSLDLKANDKVLIEKMDDKLVITKSKKEKISLAERFKNFKGSNIDDFEWDEPRGMEIW